ncbi:MAG TPA: S8 family serine peptidase, partial [Adhaeribacter sp.]|nr:S8 family serine peptidase [Adhaeribacter sp.]
MRLFYLFCLLLVCAPFTVPAQSLPQTQQIPGRLVFKLKPQYKAFAAGNTIQLEKLSDALAALQASAPEQKFPKSSAPEGVKGAVDLTLVYQITFPESQDLEKARKLLIQTGLLEYAETLRNYPPLYQPNDPLADSVSGGQYYLKNIKAYRGWDFSKGDTNIVIGILDQGVKFTHKDLARNIKYNYADPIDGIDNDGDGYIDNFRGWDLAENDNDPSNYPFGDHGVLVSGIASGSADNGTGLAGVGFNCKFLPIKVYANTTSGHNAHYEGIVYAADHGCHVINLSWGGAAPFSFFEQDVINYAVFNKNAVVVAAAGNTRAKLDFFPSSYQNVLSVATLDAANEISYQTTHSYHADLSAPGINILTTYVNHDSSYISVSGSSFAAPMVSGAAGLVKHKFPQFNARQIMEQLRVTADASIYSLPGNAGFQGLLGYGLLDVAKALSTTNAKSVRFTEVVNSKGSNTSAGDTLDLTVTFQNFLEPLTNLNVTVTSASANATVLQGTYAAGAMA